MLPADCTTTFHEHGSSKACVMDVTAPEFEAARQAMTDEWGNEAAFIGCGGIVLLIGALLVRSSRTAPRSSRRMPKARGARIRA